MKKYSHAWASHTPNSTFYYRSSSPSAVAMQQQQQQQQQRSQRAPARLDMKASQQQSSTSTSKSTASKSPHGSMAAAASPIIITPAPVPPPPPSPSSSQHQKSPHAATSRPIPIPPSQADATAGRRHRRPQHNLHLSGLPKFHPANFQHADDSGLLSPNSIQVLTARPPRGNPSGTSQARAGMSAVSDSAQTRLQQYQRDVVAGFSRAISPSHLHHPQGDPLHRYMAAQQPQPQPQPRHRRAQHGPCTSQSSLGSGPDSPHLAPKLSPSGAMTPLMLNEGPDYLHAHTTSGSSPLLSPTSSTASSNASSRLSGRDLVERLVIKENERRMRRQQPAFPSPQHTAPHHHHHHRSASGAGWSPVMSPQRSPAVSPAGGGI